MVTDRSRRRQAASRASLISITKPSTFSRTVESNLWNFFLFCFINNQAKNPAHIIHRLVYILVSYSLGFTPEGMARWQSWSLFLYFNLASRSTRIVHHLLFSHPHPVGRDQCSCFTLHTSGSTSLSVDWLCHLSHFYEPQDGLQPLSTPTPTRYARHMGHAELW